MGIKKKNMGINAILNVIRQGLSVLFPLITFPYALRVLGAEGIGKVTYVGSIISYFSLIAMLGISTYAVREGANNVIFNIVKIYIINLDTKFFNN